MVSPFLLVVLVAGSPASAPGSQAVSTRAEGVAATRVAPLPDRAIPRLRQLQGLGTMADFSLSGYYRDRSARGIAKEMRAHGFSWVLAYAHTLTPALAQAIHDEGMALGVQLWGTIIYAPAGLDSPPPDGARQIFVGGQQPPKTNPVVFCPANDDYRAWYSWFARRYLRDLSPDVVTVIETFMGSWGGPGGADYGCFCSTCLRKFTARYPSVSGFPEFKDASSPRYWKTDRKLYEQWVQFRAEVTAQFIAHAYSSAMQAAPGAAIAGSMLAVDHPEGIEKVREWNAQDLGLIARAAPWDFFLFQAHWPDWMRPELSPGHHVRSYRPFLDTLRGERPDVHAGIITDSGSHAEMRRSMPWLNAAYVNARAEGFDSLCIYEYSISRFIYEDRPTIIEVDAGQKKVELIFSKRMDAATVRVPANYTLDDGRHPSSVHFDGGNIVTLTFGGWRRNRLAKLLLTNLTDDASTFWFNGGKPPARRAYRSNRIAPGSEVSFRIP